MSLTQLAAANMMKVTWSDCGSDVGAHGTISSITPSEIPTDANFDVGIIAALNEGFTSATYKITGHIDHLPIPGINGDVCGDNLACPVAAGTLTATVPGVNLGTSLIGEADARAVVTGDNGDIIACADLKLSKDGEVEPAPVEASMLSVTWSDCGSDVGAHGTVTALTPSEIPTQGSFPVSLSASLDEGFTTATYKVTGHLDHLPFPGLTGDVCGDNLSCPVAAGDLTVNIPSVELGTGLVGEADARATVIADNGDIIACVDLKATKASALVVSV